MPQEVRPGPAPEVSRRRNVVASIGKKNEIEVLARIDELLCQPQGVRRMCPVVRPSMGEQQVSLEPLGEMKVGRLLRRWIGKAHHRLGEPALRDAQVVDPGRANGDLEDIGMLENRTRRGRAAP